MQQPAQLRLQSGQKLGRQICSIASEKGAENGAPQLSVLTFNVLADGLAQNGGFVRAPAEALQWDHRRGLLLAELVAADADIICLQECNHFEDFFQPELARLGFVGHFVPKSHSPAQQYGYAADGCAMFYRSARLSAVSPPESVAFRGGNGESAAQGMLSWRLHDRPAGRQLLVATFHLKAKPGAANDAIRHSQAQQTIATLATEAAADAAPSGGSKCSGPAQSSMQSPAGVASEASVRNACDPAQSQRPSGSSGNGSHPPEQNAAARLPVLLCGDMNAEPDSSACQALREHALGLQSVWDARSVETGLEEALLTTWKFRADGESRRVIDYVWHTVELQPVARWATPPAAAIGDNALPSMAYPSDHLACLAALQWT